MQQYSAPQPSTAGMQSQPQAAPQLQPQPQIVQPQATQQLQPQPQIVQPQATQQLQPPPQATQQPQPQQYNGQYSPHYYPAVKREVDLGYSEVLSTTYCSWEREARRLGVPRQPHHWTSQHLHAWLAWAIREFSLYGQHVDTFVCSLNLSGKELCAMGKEQFLARAPLFMGDILWTHLELLQRPEENKENCGGSWEAGAGYSQYYQDQYYWGYQEQYHPPTRPAGSDTCTSYLTVMLKTMDPHYPLYLTDKVLLFINCNLSS